MKSTNPGQRSCTKKINTLLKQQDIYGHQIQLTYNESTTFKTTFGGVFTIIARIGMLAYLVTELIKVVNKSSTLTVTERIINLSVDPYEVKLNRNNFDFAIQIAYTLADYEPEVVKNIHQYAYATVNIIDFSWKEVNGTKKEVFDVQRLELTKCEQGRFMGDKQAEEIGIQESYQCLKDINFTLTGNWASSKLKLFSLNVRKCSQAYLDINYPGQKCKNSTEIDRVFQNIYAMIPVTNQYFDEKDFTDNPIKTSIKVLYFTAHSSLGQAYTYQISENIVELSDYWLSHDVFTKEHTYYNLNLDSTFTKVADDMFSTPIAVNFMLDDNQSKIKREVYTILDALSAVGGFFGIIVIIIHSLIGFFQENMFYQSLMRKMYMIQDEINNNSRNSNKVTPIKLDGNLKNERIQEVFSQICQRLPFKITMRDYLKGLLCRKRNNNKIFKAYQQGIHKVKKEFEITKILESMKKIDLISSMFLSKYQKELMPYFAINLVDHDSSATSHSIIKTKMNDNRQVDKEKEHQQQLYQYLLQAFIKAQNNKIDKRIIKNLDQNYHKDKQKPKSKLDLLVNSHISAYLVKDLESLNDIETRQKSNKGKQEYSSGGNSELKSSVAELLYNVEEIDIDKEIMDFDQDQIQNIKY